MGNFPVSPRNGEQASRGEPRILTPSDIQYAFQIGLADRLSAISGNFAGVGNFDGALARVSYDACSIHLNDSRVITLPCTCHTPMPYHHHKDCVGYLGLLRLCEDNPRFIQKFDALLGFTPPQSIKIDPALIAKTRIPIIISGVSTLLRRAGAAHPGPSQNLRSGTAFLPPEVMQAGYFQLTPQMCMDLKQLYNSPTTQPMFPAEAQAKEAAERPASPRAAATSKLTAQESPGLRYTHFAHSGWLCNNQIIGKGHFANVFLCYNSVDHRKYALKSLRLKNTHKPHDMGPEVDILMRLGTHDNIVGLRDCFYDDNFLYIIMEYCPGGDLLHRMREVGRFSEAEAAWACRQLADALRFMHDRGITHRDLKPENILLADHTNKCLKITDFGLSKLSPPDQMLMRTVCGTWAYCAPEVIRREEYDKTVDVWSLGVLMFIMLVGYHPFDVTGSTPERQLLQNIVDVQYNFDDPLWDDVSVEARTLITRLLVADPQRRMTLEEYLSSPWVNNAQP